MLVRAIFFLTASFCFSFGSQANFLNLGGTASQGSNAFHTISSSEDSEHYDKALEKYLIGALETRGHGEKLNLQRLERGRRRINYESWEIRVLNHPIMSDEEMAAFTEKLGVDRILQLNRAINKISNIQLMTLILAFETGGHNIVENVLRDHNYHNIRDRINNPADFKALLNFISEVHELDYGFIAKIKRDFNHLLNHAYNFQD